MCGAPGSSCAGVVFTVMKAYLTLSLNLVLIESVGLVFVAVLLSCTVGPSPTPTSATIDMLAPGPTYVHKYRDTCT